jgi:hypothetical protein
MPERPLIVLPQPALAERGRPPGGGGPIHLPTLSKQGTRLNPRFQAIRDYFQNRLITLQVSAAGAVPEEIVVFETVGPVTDFLRAAEKIPGFDLMGEIDSDEIPPDDDFFLEEDRETPITGRLFLVMSNQQALQQLLSLWQRFRQTGNVPYGFGPFKQAFRLLHDVRLWGVEDRLRETGVENYWREAASVADDALVPFAIQMWYREPQLLRRQAAERVLEIIGSAGGQIARQTDINEIRYHCLIAVLPASQIRQLVSRNDVSLLSDSAIMLFRPTGQSFVAPPDQVTLQQPSAPASQLQPSGSPVVALFDGMPLENHARLTNRLVVDDPDNFATRYTAVERDYGTTMASIIVHGDLNAPQTPSLHPLYVRPIMRPDPQPWDMSRAERIPHNVDEVDLIHRAVRRLYEAEGGNAPASPQVRVINLSVANSLQQFNGAVSAWGRLLDWLSFKYNVLICVSCGNHTEPIELNVARGAFGGLSASRKQEELLKALQRDVRIRRILSPSDSINSLTIGGWHHDFGAVAPIAYRFDPMTQQPLPSPINALGLGFRNAHKPDALFPSGRQFYLERLGTGEPKTWIQPDTATVAPGILAASPSGVAGQLDREKHSRGTSNSTAFATRTAAFLYDQLLNLRNETGGEVLTDDFIAVLLKSAVVHTASWRGALDSLRPALKLAGMREDRFKRLAARFLGYGFVSPADEIICDDHRATMIGCGRLGDGQAHEFAIPLPSALSGIRGVRRLTATLAWFSPIHLRHRNYRTACLWYEIENKKLSAERRDTEWRLARNGTIQHEVFEGDRAVPIGSGDFLNFKVNCRADAGELRNTVRYGILVTMEVAPELGVPIYDEIATRVRAPITVGAQTH